MLVQDLNFFETAVESSIVGGINPTANVDAKTYADDYSAIGSLSGDATGNYRTGVYGYTRSSTKNAPYNWAVAGGYSWAVSYEIKNGKLNAKLVTDYDAKRSTSR